MNKLVNYAVIFLAAALMSGPAVAQIDYSEDFEGLDAGDGGALSGAGWLVFGNVFADFPGCSAFIYNYGPFPAPNGGPGFSSVVTGTSTGQALNVYSDYNNGDHGAGRCIEANVFQEVVIEPADPGTYYFIFDVEVPGPLGEDVSTLGFIKVLDPNAGFALTAFETVDTETAGTKVIAVNLDGDDVGSILQWGFASNASFFRDTGRWYDNISFSQDPPITDSPDLAVPTLGNLGLLLLVIALGGIGVFTLTRRS